MIPIILILGFLAPAVHAEVVAEKSVTIGYHNKSTISLREHKLKTGRGYSITKQFPDRKVTGHPLTAQKYLEFKTNLEKNLKPMSQQSLRSIASCGETVVLSNKFGKSDPEISGICMDDETLAKRKDFVRWLKVVSKYL